MERPRPLLDWRAGWGAGSEELCCSSETPTYSDFPVDRTNAHTLDVFTLNDELPVTRGKYQSRGYDVLGTMDSDFDAKTRIPEMGKTWK